MSTAKPITVSRRLTNYAKQSRILTDRQARRLRHKTRRTNRIGTR